MDLQELKSRIQSAIILIKAGHSFKVGDLYFGTSDDNHFQVTGETMNNNFENISKQSAISEISDVKNLFLRIVSVSPELSAFISNKKIQYNLVYNYGMGDLIICSELDGKIRWESKLID